MAVRGDQLLAYILAGGDGEGEAANELLREFFRGYPIEKLRMLLYSSDKSAVETGAWIASELGEEAAPLANELSILLDHPSMQVRFDLLDVVLVATTPGHGEALARAVLLIRDPERAVRWKALWFLAKVTEEQLAAALPHLVSSSVTPLLTWLLSVGSNPDAKQEVITRLRDTDPLTRLFATAAAARLAQYDLVALEHAAASTDQEVSKFANEELQRQSRSHKKRGSSQTP